MAEEETNKPRSASKPRPITSKRRKEKDEKSHNSSEESSPSPNNSSGNKPSSSSRRNVVKAGGSRARANMRKSIMLFEEKLTARSRQSRDRIMKRGDATAVNKSDRDGKRSRSRDASGISKHKSRSLSRGKQRIESKGSKSEEQGEPTSSEAASQRAAERKKMARSVGINSNERSSFRVPRKSSTPEERDGKAESRDGSKNDHHHHRSDAVAAALNAAGVDNVGKSKNKEEDKKKSSSSPKNQSKKLSASTGNTCESPLDSLLKSKLSRKDSQDDLSLLGLRKKSTTPQISRNNSFNASNSTDLLADLRKSKGHNDSSSNTKDMNKSSHSVDKSDRNKDRTTTTDSTPRKTDNKKEAPIKKEAPTLYSRRHSDVFSKSINKSNTSTGGQRKPQLRRNSMDESTLELFASTKHKAVTGNSKPLKKIPSLSSMGKVDSSTVDKSEKSEDILGAFSAAPWGRGGNKGSNISNSTSNNLKKSFNSSEGGMSLDKTDKEKKEIKKKREPTAVVAIDKKDGLRKTVSTASSSVNKVDKKKSVRKTQQPRPHNVDTASPVVASQEKGIRVSRLTMCAVCIMYIVSLALVGVLGFWVHMAVFPTEENQFSIPEWAGGGGDGDGGEGEKATSVVVVDTVAESSPTYSPSTTLSPSMTAVPTTETRAPTIKPTKKKKPNKQQSKPEQQAAISKNENPPSKSISPTISTSPSITPRPSSLTPTMLPSLTPTTSTPTLAPSTVEPTLSHYPSSTPSNAPSDSAAPSSPPTGIPRCPEELLKTADLGPQSLITMRYEIIPLPPSDPYGGLFCVSIEYEGNAGWLGFAVSGASRDPAFGRKEAIIGIPGVSTLVAVADPSKYASVGQQVGTGIIDGPALINPGKYEIPAGGGVDGYTGPSIDTMLELERQTLLNSSIAIVGPDDSPLQKPLTTMTFTKYLIEPEEIEIDPFAKTLFLYAVATIDEDGEYNDNPEWVANYVTLLQTGGTAVERDGVKRKRLRHHVDLDA